MNGEAIEQARQALADDFFQRVNALRRDGVGDYPPLGGMIPWADVSEQRKLEAIIWESMTVSGSGESFERDEIIQEVISVPGSVALDAVERNVDYAGLPAAQRHLLEELRGELASGYFDAIGADDTPKDFVHAGLARVVGIDHFEQMLDAVRNNVDDPWAGRSDIEKLRFLVDAATEAGPPGAYAVAAIEREVAYDMLPAWRREDLVSLRYRLDAGDFDYEIPDRASHDDPGGRALRQIELKARIEDNKRFGVLDDRGERRAWDTLGETDKFELIMEEIQALRLESEPAAYARIAAEVDRSRIPLDTRRDFEQRWAQAWAGLEMERDAFDEVVADLRQRWYDDGLGATGKRWEDQPVLTRVAYLADFAAAMDVAFDRFADATLDLFGVAAQSQLTSNQEWFMGIAPSSRPGFPMRSGSPRWMACPSPRRARHNRIAPTARAGNPTARPASWRWISLPAWAARNRATAVSTMMSWILRCERLEAWAYARSAQARRLPT